MTSTQTIALTCSIILCVIGVATFISGMLTKARKDGQLEYKVDSALKGIEEIKKNLSHLDKWQDELALTIRSNEEKIATLFVNYNKMDERLTEMERSVYGTNIQRSGDRT